MVFHNGASFFQTKSQGKNSTGIQITWRYKVEKVSLRIWSVRVNEVGDVNSSITQLFNTCFHMWFLCVCEACGLTCRDLWFLSHWVVEGQVQPAVADLQLQSLGLWVQLHRQQQPVWVPRPELEADRETPCGRRCWRKRQEAAAGAQKGAGHQLGLRAWEGHIALEDDKPQGHGFTRGFSSTLGQAGITANTWWCFLK